MPQNLHEIKSTDRITLPQTVDSVLSKATEDNFKLRITGDEASGKTAMAKFIVKNLFTMEYIPVLMQGDDFSSNIRTDNIWNEVLKKIDQQYECLPDIYREKRGCKKMVIVIDDFHKSVKGKDQYWELLTNNLKQLFDNIIIIGDSLLSASEYKVKNAFNDFSKYSIMEFGPRLRQQLIDKWYSLGIDCTLESQNKLLEQRDRATKHINRVLGKHYVPSFPLYILGMLQSLEINQSDNSNFSVYGVYYELLIQARLAKAVQDKYENNFFYHFMVEYCYWLFSNRTKRTSIDNFDEFCARHCKSLDIENMGATKIKDTLNRAGMLYFDDEVFIRHKYIFYFFVAHYLADHIEDTIIQNKIVQISLRVFMDEYASIILFLTHLSKHPFIINTLLANANGIFAEYEPSRLEKDVTAINNLVMELPQRVIEAINIDKERDEELEYQEEIETLQKLYDDDDDDYAKFSLDDDINSIDIVAKTNTALKTIDLLGQIAKKSWGEMDASHKYDILISAYNLGLRTLGLYIKSISEDAEGVTEYVMQLIKDRFGQKNAEYWAKYKDKKLKEISARTIFGLIDTASYSIIKRVANSVGYNRLNPTYNRILENNPFNSYKLINLSIGLNYAKFNTTLISGYCTEMKNNRLCFRLLQDLVINHLYMFNVDHKDLATISNKLDISINQQRIIQGTSQVKRIEKR